MYRTQVPLFDIVLRNCHTAFCRGCTLYAPAACTGSRFLHVLASAYCFLERGIEVDPASRFLEVRPSRAWWPVGCAAGPWSSSLCLGRGVGAGGEDSLGEGDIPRDRTVLHGGRGCDPGRGEETESSSALGVR